MTSNRPYGSIIVAVICNTRGCNEHLLRASSSFPSPSRTVSAGARILFKTCSGVCRAVRSHQKTAKKRPTSEKLVRPCQSSPHELYRSGVAWGYDLPSVYSSHGIWATFRHQRPSRGSTDIPAGHLAACHYCIALITAVVALAAYRVGYVITERA